LKTVTLSLISHLTSIRVWMQIFSNSSPFSDWNGVANNWRLEDHGARIAYLMSYFPEDPIEVDIGEYSPYLQDGHHRLLAALYSGRHCVTIEVLIAEGLEEALSFSLQIRC